MIYLPDKRERKEEGGRVFVAVAFFVLIIASLFLLPRSADFLAKQAAALAKSVLGEESILAENLTAFRTLLSEKEALLFENESFKEEMFLLAAIGKEIEPLRKENESLRALLGRSGSAPRVAAVVLLKPNRSPYDTLLIDIGKNEGLSGGERVFADGFFIGAVGEAYDETARVTLHSAPGKEFDARLKNADVIVIGRGGGSFETTVPKTLRVSEGDEVTVPSLGRLLLGLVAGVIEDPRDPLSRVLIEAPVSLSWLTVVLVELK